MWEKHDSESDRSDCEYAYIIIRIYIIYHIYIHIIYIYTYYIYNYYIYTYYIYIFISQGAMIEPNIA